MSLSRSESGSLGDCVCCLMVSTESMVDSDGLRARLWRL